MGKRARFPKICLTEQQKRAMRRFAEIAKGMSALKGLGYTESQLDNFAHDMCTEYRILNNQDKYQESETIKEWREGGIKLFSTVVTKERQIRHCHRYYHQSLDCKAENCPAWEFYSGEQEKGGCANDNSNEQD